MDLKAQFHKMAEMYAHLPKWAKIAVPVAGAGVILLIWQPWKAKGTASSLIESGKLGNPNGSGLPQLPILGSYGQVPIGNYVTSSGGGGTTTIVDPPPTSTTTTVTPGYLPPSTIPPNYFNPGPSSGAKQAVKVGSTGGGGVTTTKVNTSTSPSTGDQNISGEPSGTSSGTTAEANPSTYQAPVEQATNAFGSNAVGQALAAGKITPQQARALALFRSISGQAKLKNYQTPVKQATTAFGSTNVGKAVVSRKITVQQARAYSTRSYRSRVKSQATTKVINHPAYHPPAKVMKVTRTYHGQTAQQMRAYAARGGA